MGLNELVTSKGYVNFMTKLYGWGASVVIIGALFKIMHWPGAGIVLTAGMVTEALIFFFSAFEPPLPHYNWSLVFPQLAIGEEAHDAKDKKAPKLPSNAPITQQLDNALTEAKIGPELLESLASGMRNLGENAKKLSGVSDAAAATDGYVSNLSKAADSVKNLSGAYNRAAETLENTANKSGQYFENIEKATSSVKTLAGIYEKNIAVMSEETGFNAEMDRLAKNLSAMNAAYEIQIKTANNTMNTTKSLDDYISTLANNLTQSTDSVAAYKEQIDKLAQNVSKLNGIYGNMLAAMSNR
ncbi:MAG: gliding motility protein GldL [Bacteroidales bacterium]|nr:gliding motility protein GldL [Bacteroidales bacterium]